MLQSSEPDEMIIIGRIMRAVGLDGLCAVEPLGYTLESIEPPCEVIIGDREDSSTSIILEEVEFRPKNLVCRFEGCDDKDKADLLRGKNIYIKQSELPLLEQDEFYHFELIGMNVYSDREDELIGVVSDVFNFPSADTLEVKRHSGETTLIPFINEAVVKVDKSSRCIIFRHSFIEDLL